MDSTERRKLHKLLRRPTLHPMHKTNSKCKQTTNKNVSKQPKPAATAEEAANKGQFGVDMIHLCAEMSGISNISPEACKSLQGHINGLTGRFMQQVVRIMEQSRRGTPQVSDIDAAASIIGLVMPFGSAPVSFVPIRTGGRAGSSSAGSKVVFVRPDREIDLKAEADREPIKPAPELKLIAHWLAINGKQPEIPQNPPPEFLARLALIDGRSEKNEFAKPQEGESKKPQNVEERADDSSEPVSQPLSMTAIVLERRPHEVSRELMVYFRELTETCVGACEVRRQQALDYAALDPSLQPLVPHLVAFITEGVRMNVAHNNLAILIYLIRLAKALIDNPHVSLEPYLHFLLPTVITCVVSRQLCAQPLTDSHWALRGFAAKQLVTICNRHSGASNEIYNRVTQLLSRALCAWIDGQSSGSDNGGSSTGMASFPPVQTAGCATDPEPEVSVESSSTRRSVNAKVGGINLGRAVNSMNTLYGILTAFAEFGLHTMRQFVFPVLSELCQRLTRMLECTKGSSTLLERPTGLASELSLAQSRLSPQDRRSFDLLKSVLTNRFAAPLVEWRSRQTLGLRLEDYVAAYGYMAPCLHSACPQQPTTSTATVASTRVTSAEHTTPSTSS